VRKHRNTSANDSNDPRRTSSAGTSTEQTIVIGGYYHTDGKGSKHVEEQDTPEDTLHSLGDVLSGILRFTCSNRNHLDTTVGEGSVDECGEEASETSGVANANVRLHRGPRLRPVTESKAALIRRTAKIDDKSKEEQADDCDDLYGCEDELGFTINGDGEDIQTDDEGEDDGDPSGLVNSIIPEPDDDGSGRDLGAEGERVADPVVPSDSESEGRVDVTSAVLRDGTRERKPGRHLAQALHHGVDGDTGKGVTEENRERTRAHEGLADTEE